MTSWVMQSEVKVGPQKSRAVIHQLMSNEIGEAVYWNITIKQVHLLCAIAWQSY